MKRFFTILFALLVVSMMASAKKELNSGMYVSWGGNYLTVEGKTATFTDAWQGAASLWLQLWDSETESNVPDDYSDYDYFVVEFTQPLNAGLQVTLEDGTWSNNNTTKAQAAAGDTYIALPLASASIDLTHIEQAYFQNTEAGTTFTVKSVWVGSADDLQQLKDGVLSATLSLQEWSAWEATISQSYDSSTGTLTVDFGETAGWSGVSKWLGGFDASDYDYLVFEFSEMPSKDCQAFISYTNSESWQTSWISAGEGTYYLKLALNADNKNSIAQVGVQNATAEGATFTLKAAYWMKTIDHADMPVGWLTREGLTDETRALFANYGNMDYLVFDFNEPTPAAMTFLAKYGGNTPSEPWWANDTESEAVTTDANLLTCFVPLTKVDFSQLWQIGYAITADEEASYDLKGVYYATTDYLTETIGYTADQIANHIYQADYVALPLSELSFGSQDGYDYAGKVTSTMAADESELTVVSKDIDIDNYSVQLGWDYASATASDDTRQKLTTSWTNMDYLVIDFTVPVANEYVGIDVSTEAGGTSRSIRPLEKTIIIPIKEYTENAEAESLQMLLYLAKNSILHISEVYLASEDYLKDKLQSDDIPSAISFEGEEVTIGSTGYATIYYGNHNYSLVLPYGVKGYDYGQVDGKLQEIDVIEPDGLVAPHRALVLKLEDGMEPGTYYLPCHPTQQADDAPEGSRLAGSDEACTTTSGDGSDAYFYKLSTKNGENVGFYWGDPEGGQFTSKAHKAWLWLPKEGNNAAAGYFFDENMNLVADQTTGISQLNIATTDDAPAYNLSGQRVNADYRGIIIQNGKKVMR